MNQSVHIVDLTWALLALVAGAYPVWRFSSHLQRQASRDFCALIVLLATYPTLLALFHLTPFDLGRNQIALSWTERCVGSKRLFFV